jgi:hypothetical protein
MSLLALELRFYFKLKLDDNAIRQTAYALRGPLGSMDLSYPLNEYLSKGDTLCTKPQKRPHGTGSARRWIQDSQHRGPRIRTQALKALGSATTCNTSNLKL